MYEQGEVKSINPAKQIATEVILEVIIRHRDAMKQARTGELPDVPIEKMQDNLRKLNQVRALNKIISAQREMITISRPTIFNNSLHKWKRKNREEKAQEENPFETTENDYNKIIEWKDFLKHCEKSIREAEVSPELDDDFMLTKTGGDGEEINELTNNFYDMIDDLEHSYEQIYLLMLVNKIVSAGIEEDEELTYKEKEEEGVRRVVEA